MNLRGRAGSAEVQEAGLPRERAPGLLENRIVFSPSGAWATKGRALQGSVEGWGKRRPLGDGAWCPSRRVQRCGHSLPASSGLVILPGDRWGPPHTPAPTASQHEALSLSLWSLCHVFFATWYHLTREVASRSPAEDLGAFQVLGERDAVTAVTSSELGGVPWNPEAASASQQS